VKKILKKRRKKRTKNKIGIGKSCFGPAFDLRICADKKQCFKKQQELHFCSKEVFLNEVQTTVIKNRVCKT
jgi:hypothetical protein